jgi:hypothetical protein
MDLAVNRQELPIALEVLAEVAAVGCGSRTRPRNVPSAPAAGHRVQAAADLLGEPLDAGQVGVTANLDGFAP